MPTPISAAQPFLTDAEFLQRADVRSAGDLLSKDGRRLPAGSAELSSLLLELARGASGELESACLRGGRYAVADIQAVLSQGGNGAAFVKNVVAGLVLRQLTAHRLNADRPVPPAVEWAERQVEALEKGGRILPLGETAGAGGPSLSALTGADLQKQRGVVTEAERLFGRRTKRDRG